MKAEKGFVWVDNPPDNSDLKIDILPSCFDANSFCTQCGGAIDLDYTCCRCGADFYPAIRRIAKERAAHKAAYEESRK